ncbi:YdhR family protein [Rubrobacter marinus]|nr:YdhR family protein [Rubrobacter marinus]
MIVNFRLEDVSEEEYRNQCEAIAPAFAGLPGLVSKTWLADAETNTYGGVYAWRDRQAMEDYRETDIYKGMLANPHFGDLTVRDFAVLEGPTRVTRGLSGTPTPAVGRA